MNIVFVGLSGVPYSGRACDPRLAAIANLLAGSNSITIVNRYSSYKLSRIDSVVLKDNVKVIELIKSRPAGHLVTKLLCIWSVLVEPFRLIQLNSHAKIDYLHLYTGHFVDFVLYYILSRIIGAKIVYEYVEYRSAKHYKGLYHKINNWLCDNYGPYLWDKCIVISEFLKKRTICIRPKLPVLKVTPLCDFDLFDKNQYEIDIAAPYVMFCGSADYFEVVKLVIDAYKGSMIKETKRLLLVLGGSDNGKNKVREYDAECIIKSKLPYGKLIAYYKHAYALLIPLRNDEEDTARFPNKICEYTAAKGLIVTTNYGEIKHYFKNGENAVVANECSVNEISKRLDDIENGHYNQNTIKENSYETGLNNFSISCYHDKLNQFLKDSDE